jgi:hypothetical protein
MSWWQKLTGKARIVFGSPSGKDECDHSTLGLREGTAELELFVARAELESGKDLQHGANHLAKLLSYDPGRVEWLDLLKDYLRRAGPDPEALIPRGENSISARKRCEPTFITSKVDSRKRSICLPKR